MEQKASWFTFVEVARQGRHGAGAQARSRRPALQFPHGLLAAGVALQGQGSPGLEELEPFRRRSIHLADPKSITDFEASADIVLHKGQMDDANPLAFEAGAVSDLLINQVHRRNSKDSP